MSKTTENLKAAFAGESQARNKYTFFAKVARKEGYHYIAKIFEETAENEKQHAKDHLKLLNGIGDTTANLKEAMGGEDYEVESMYPDFAKIAEEEGEKEAAMAFKQVAKIEAHHRERYKKLLQMVTDRHRLQARAGNQVEMQHLRLHGRRRRTAGEMSIVQTPPRILRARKFGFLRDPKVSPADHFWGKWCAASIQHVSGGLGRPTQATTSDS